MFGPFRFFPGTMASADFLRFVVTAHFFRVRKTSPGTHTFFPSLPAAFTVERIRVAIGLCFSWQTYPRLRPYMRFLYVRPEICPLGDLSTPKIRLSSDSASRRTPLPLANPSRYRADSGLSPYRTCAHRAHQNWVRQAGAPFYCFSRHRRKTLTASAAPFTKASNITAVSVVILCCTVQWYRLQ